MGHIISDAYEGIKYLIQDYYFFFKNIYEFKPEPPLITPTNSMTPQDILNYSRWAEEGRPFGLPWQERLQASIYGEEGRQVKRKLLTEKDIEEIIEDTKKRKL